MVPPAGASAGVTEVTPGLGTSNCVEIELWLGTEFTVTTIEPVVAEAGDAATICVSLQLLTVAGVPLKVMVLFLWLAWNPEPVIVICEPATPPAGTTMLIAGGGTVKILVALLLMPPTVTTAGPEAAVTGTAATICVSLQLLMAAGCPLKETMLVP